MMNSQTRWCALALTAIGTFGISACTAETDSASIDVGQHGDAITLVTCDGPEDVALPCGANGRVCSMAATCVYPAACNSSATGAGVFRGDLTIDGADTAGDIAQLADIWCVTGHLRVQSTSLTDLAPLHGLIAVGNSVTVQQNPILLSLSGLDTLQRTGSVRVVANPKVPSLQGLGGLKTLSSLEVVGNGLLTTLDGLAPVDITSSVSLTGNGKLLEVNALSGIVGSMFGYLHIQNEASLEDLSGFSAVTSVGSSLRVFNADALVDLHGLDSVTKVGGELYVALNDGLESLDGLDAITQLGSARIQTNPLLSECAVSELVVRTGAICNSCSGQVACEGGSACAAFSCTGSACLSAPVEEDTPCSDGYCDAEGACVSPAVIEVFSVSDGSVFNPPSTRNGVYNPGDRISFSTRVRNVGPVTFATSSVRVTSADPYVLSPRSYPIYTNQVLPGSQGNSFPTLQIANNAPEGHVIELAIEVDFTIDGATRTASLPQSLLAGPGDAHPGVPLTLEWIAYDDGDYRNGVTGRDGHLSPGEYVSVDYRLRSWAGVPVQITSTALLQEYPSTTTWTSAAQTQLTPWNTQKMSAYVIFDAAAPLGTFEGILEVKGNADGEPYVARLPMSFPITSP